MFLVIRQRTNLPYLLQAVAETLGDTAMTTAVSNATKTLTAMAVSEAISLSLPKRFVHPLIYVAAFCIKSSNMGNYVEVV